MATRKDTLTETERSLARWTGMVHANYVFLVFAAIFVVMGMAKSELIYSFMGLGLIVLDGLAMLGLVLYERGR